MFVFVFQQFCVDIKNKKNCRGVFEFCQASKMEPFEKVVNDS